MKYKVLIGILAVLFCGCGKDKNPCEISKDGENNVLSDSAKTFVSNYIDADRIIFKTLSGDELSFDVLEKDSVVSYQVGFPCEDDTLQGQTVKGTSEVLSYSLINTTVISKPLIINVLEFPKLPTQQAQESVIISLGTYLSNSFGDGDLLFDYNINVNNPQLNYLDSFVIAGRTFYSVYETNYSAYLPNLEVKYSVEKGVIYIKDPHNSMEYIYERKE